MMSTAWKSGDRFHNPYSFVPFGERPKEGPLADAQPSGHARYTGDALSGMLEFTMEVRTPLLIPDRWDRDGEKHRTFGVLRDHAGTPIVHGASIKGALRSAYEIVTGSRVPFADGWREPLSRRLEAASAIGLIPVRIVRPEGSDQVEAEILLGRIPGIVSSAQLRKAVRDKKHPLPAAFLPAYDLLNPHRTMARLLDLEGDQDPRRARIAEWHGRKVEVQLQRYRHRNGRFELWVVESLEASGTQDAVPSHPRGPFERGYTKKGDPITARGYLFLTGRNASNKHYERVFFSTSSEPPRLPVSESAEAGWRSVIRAYLDAHSAGDLRSTAALRDMAKDWSAHMYDKGRRQLCDGDLCYAVIESDGEGGHRIASLQPVAISRRPYSATPFDLAPADVRPASMLHELSPADRLFGWVRDGKAPEGAHRDASVAFRGTVRVERVDGLTADSVADLERPVPLAVLGAPKPANPRMYFGDAAGQPLDEGKQRSEIDFTRPKGDGPAETGLRGRKVYPPHRAAERDDVTVPPHARRAGDVADSQNSTVSAWVRPGERITVRLGLSEVSPAELGALLEVLALCSTEHGRFRLGYAKPLGFGSLRVDRDSIELRVVDGEDIRFAYRDGRVPAPSLADAGRVEELLDSFREAQRRAGVPGWDDGPPLAIRRAFEGPGDDHPVTYPVAVDGRGTVLEGYAWFVENDARGLRSLPAIDADDPSLQVLEPQQEEPKQRSGGGQKKPDRPQGNRGGSDRGHRGGSGRKQGGST